MPLSTPFGVGNSHWLYTWDIETLISTHLFHSTRRSLYYLEQALKQDYDVKHLGMYKNNVFILAASWGRMDILNRLLEYVLISTNVIVEDSTLCARRFLYNNMIILKPSNLTAPEIWFFVSNDFRISFEYWPSALQLRNLYDFPRQTNSEFVDNIGKAYMSLKELKPLFATSLTGVTSFSCEFFQGVTHIYTMLWRQW